MKCVYEICSHMGNEFLKKVIKGWFDYLNNFNENIVIETDIKKINDRLLNLYFYKHYLEYYKFAFHNLENVAAINKKDPTIVQIGDEMQENTIIELGNSAMYLNDQFVIEKFCFITSLLVTHNQDLGTDVTEDNNPYVTKLDIIGNLALHQLMEEKPPLMLIKKKI